MEKLKSKVPVFGKAKLEISNVGKIKKTEFQCLEKQNPEFNCFEKAKRLNSESMGHEAEDRMGY